LTWKKSQDRSRNYVASFLTPALAFQVTGLDNRLVATC
jgi:hypothetical protein